MEYRQYKVYKNTDKVPVELEKQIDQETFKKAKAYAIDKVKFGFIAGLYGEIQSTVVICCFLMPFFWNLSKDIMTSEIIGASKTNSRTIEWEIFQSILFTLITSFASTIVNLPISIYGTFVIEQKHGFNKQTAMFFAWDKCKVFIVSSLISAPIMAVTVYIVRNGGPYFFLYLWMFCFVVICILTFFHGEIAALFDKFTPLPPGNLRSQIEKLSSSLKFPLKNIFVVEGSKRSAHSNAYQSGILNRKRIVIYDTLISGYYDHKKTGEEEEKMMTEEEKKDKKKEKGCNNDEILAVLCHELGHWHCGHLMKHLAFAETNYFFMFLIFSRFYKDPEFYSAFGFENEMPVIIGLALLMSVLTPYSQVLGFISTYLSRYHEYEADNFAKSLGHRDNLKTSLIKLNIDNLGFPVYDELYSMFNHSHPTLIQRLKALDKPDKNE